MATILVAGLTLSTESAIARICSAAALRLKADAACPPSREGQCATMKRKGSSSIVPHIVTMPRVRQLGSETIRTGMSALPSSLKTSGR